MQRPTNPTLDKARSERHDANQCAQVFRRVAPIIIRRGGRHLRPPAGLCSFRCPARDRRLGFECDSDIHSARAIPANRECGSLQKCHLAEIETLSEQEPSAADQRSRRSTVSGSTVIER